MRRNHKSVMSEQSGRATASKVNMCLKACSRASVLWDDEQQEHNRRVQHTLPGILCQGFWRTILKIGHSQDALSDSQEMGDSGSKRED